MIVDAESFPSQLTEWRRDTSSSTPLTWRHLPLMKMYYEVEPETLDDLAASAAVIRDVLIFQ